jgi:hypothetical protein
MRKTLFIKLRDIHNLVGFSNLYTIPFHSNFAKPALKISAQTLCCAATMYTLRPVTNTIEANVIPHAGITSTRLAETGGGCGAARADWAAGRDGLGRARTNSDGGAGNK